jgi:O-antigen ligase
LLILAALLGAGVIALVLGLALDYDLRDVGRDLRWWTLYGALGLAIVVGARREQLFAAFLVAMTLFAVVVITATALPVMPGGLKHGALVYDLGLLRMQFGNSPFLLPAIAYFAYAVLRRARAADIALLAILSGALMLSLTRTSILTAIGVIGLIVIAAYVWPELRGRRPRLVQAALVLAVTAAAGGAALGLDIASTPAKPTIPAVPGNPAVVVSPVDRILFQGDSSDLGATVSSESGRFGSYRNAVALIARSPIVGHGLGSLVAVPFAYDANRANTLRMQPGVDDAYLTLAMKAGILGALAFAVLLAFAARRVLRDRADRAWLAPAWAGLLVLTVTQSFAVSNYGPFALALFVAFSIRGYAASSGPTAASQV